MKRITNFLILLFFIAFSHAQTKQFITLPKEELMDKIKGGWAGQTIGVTYGGPTEFRYKGTMIQYYYPIVKMPINFIKRKLEIFWNYDLSFSKHTLKLKWLNPKAKVNLNVGNMIVYWDKPKQ